MGESPVPKSKFKLSDLIFSAVFPLVFGKVLIMYFGANYVKYPDEGYGYGLAFTIAFTLFMAGRLIWKYRNY